MNHLEAEQPLNLNALLGMILGAIFGALAGAIVLALALLTSEGSALGMTGKNLAGYFALIGAFIGGVLGSIVGIIIGAKDLSIGAGGTTGFVVGLGVIVVLTLMGASSRDIADMGAMLAVPAETLVGVIVASCIALLRKHKATISS